MSSPWSLPKLLAQLHDDIEHDLSVARETIGHSTTKGDESEYVWLKLLKNYLPDRYQVIKAHVVDSQGTFSEQIDIVVRDRQYSPFIFRYKQHEIVPVESVYAVFEAKQTVNASLVTYAQAKAESVRRLYRTSLPIPHAGGTYPAREPHTILAGLLTFESDWSPSLGEPLKKALATDDPNRQLDLGCIAAHGTFALESSGVHTLSPGGKPATAFLLELIARLQAMATVPMIDIRAYAVWLPT